MLTAADGDVLRLESMVDIDTELALRQIPDVTYGRLHREVFSQVFADGDRLGGRFHDYQRVLSRPLRSPKLPTSAGRDERGA